MISRTFSTPAAWPSISDWLRAFAQRRLPSMMMATWRGNSSRGTSKGSVGAASGDPMRTLSKDDSGDSR
jgi:hypothetical protein